MRKNFINSLSGRPNTIKTKKSLYSNWIEPYLPIQVSLEDKEFFTYMVGIWDKNELKNGTIRGLVTLLREYFQWAHGRDVKFKVVSEPQSQVQLWSHWDAKTALTAAKQLDKELYLMLVVTLHSGLRKGELLGLRWGDIDFVRGKINVSRSYDGPTKSGKPRSLPLSKEVEELLRNDYTIGRDGDLIFRRFDPNNKLAALCRNAQVPGITWHGLRHTFATLALEAGVSPKLVSTALGHSKLSTTLDIYWHVLGEDINLDFLP